ncbi:reverse transcriptase domain-containing protein [Tanacetum coccineum]
MTGVLCHIAEHMLNIHEGCLPVRQKTRGQAPERNKLAIKPDDGKKHDSSWRMCVDFKDLNKACPKDGYLLLEIDWKVESLSELAMLTAPKEKEELIIYLAAVKEAISAVLITKRDGKQVPIYFVSRALQGPEINYTLMEKLILALVSASK